MTPPLPELPVYISHKKVRASEITHVGSYRTNADDKLVRDIRVKDLADAVIEVPGDAFARYAPIAGDFYVEYADGYQSFSPRKAFVEGYTLASPGTVLMEQLTTISQIGSNEALLGVVKDSPAWQLMARVAREAYVTINSLKHQVEQLEKRDREQKTDLDPSRG